MPMEDAWAPAISGWRAHMIQAGLTPATVDLRCYQLGRIADEVGATPNTLTTPALVAWLAAQDWKPNTRRTYRASLRAFYAWALRAGLVLDSPALDLPRVRVPRAQPRPTPERDYRLALMTAPRRVRLAIVLAGQYGLRRGELARARRDWVEPDLDGHSLRVQGKGGHVRLVPLDEDTASLILGMPEGWLFPSPARPGQHLTPHHLSKLITAHLPEGLTTHTLRHRCGTVAYQATQDLRAVQELLGHAKPETTAIYTRPSVDVMRAAIRATG